MKRHVLSKTHLVFVFILFIQPVKAQFSSTNSTEQIKIENKLTIVESDVIEEAYEPIKRGVSIWNGDASLLRSKYYRDLRQYVQYELNLNIHYTKLITDRIGVGGAGFANVYSEGITQGVSVGSFGIGPLIRDYVWQNPQLQTYLQVQVFGGLDMALGDALGTIEDSGFRIRPEAQAGLTYRLSNTVGIFMEAGPAWEGEVGGEMDSRGFQLSFGIQLLQF